MGGQAAPAGLGLQHPRAAQRAAACPCSVVRPGLRRLDLASAARPARPTNSCHRAIFAEGSASGRNTRVWNAGFSPPTALAALYELDGSGKPLSAVDFDALARDIRGQRRDQVKNCACTFLGSAEAAERNALPERLEQLRRAESFVEWRIDDAGCDRIDPDVSRRELLRPSARKRHHTSFGRGVGKSAGPSTVAR